MKDEKKRAGRNALKQENEEESKQGETIESHGS